MSNKLPPVIVPVSSSTGKAYEDLDALIAKEGNQALKEKWAAFTNDLRIYLQIEYTPAASPGGTKPPTVATSARASISPSGDSSGKGTRRRP